MYIKYIFGNDWPTKHGGASFSVFSSYGISEASNKNKIELILKNKTKNTNYENILKEYFGLKTLSNFNMKFLNKKSFLISDSTAFYLQTYHYLKKEAESGKLDIVITRKTGFLPYLYFLKKKYNIKVLYEAHDFYLDLKEQKNKKYRKMIFQKLFLPKIDGIICHHETMKTLYKNYLPNQNYLVAKTGIKKIYTKNITENILAYVGTLDKRKSIKDIFSAINILNEYNLKLIIIGGKNSEIINKYKNIARKLNVWDRVEITGWIPRKKVDEILKKVKIGIVPLDDVFFNCYLTSPMKIFNYFSHGYIAP